MYSFNVQTACQAYAYSVLSGMRTLEQVKDNTNASDGTQPLTEEEKSALTEARRIYRESTPIKQSEIDRYKGLLYHGVPVSAILQTYSICQVQPIRVFG